MRPSTSLKATLKTVTLMIGGLQTPWKGRDTGMGPDTSAVIGDGDMADEA